MSSSPRTEQGNARAKVGMEPPEGEHFCFEDTGRGLVLRTRSIPNSKHVMLVAGAGLAWTTLGVFMMIAASAVIWASALVAVIVVPLSLAATWFIAESLAGTEAVVFGEDRIVIRRRAIVFGGTQSYERSDCSNLRPVHVDGIYHAHRLTGYGSQGGGLAFDCHGRIARFAAALTEEEAVQARRFLLSRCPDLGPRM